MRKKFWGIFLILIGVLWIIGSTYCYICKIRGHCQKTEKVVQEPILHPFQIKDGDKIIVESKHPFSFKIGTNRLYSDNNVNAVFKTLQTYLDNNPDKYIVIDGLYAEKEPGNSDLGFARSDTLKMLFHILGVDTSRIKLRSSVSNELLFDERKKLVLNAANIYFAKQLDLGALANKLLRLKPVVYFDFAKSNVKMNNKIHAYINNLKTYIKEKPNASVTIDGHTDDIGSSYTNMRLSKERANNLKQALVERGIPAGNINIKGHGFYKPVANNNTEAGRAKNRRAEITFIK